MLCCVSHMTKLSEIERDEFKKSALLIICHMPDSILSLISQACWLTIECQIVQSNPCQVQAFQDNLWANFWQFSNRFEFLLLELVIIQARTWNIVQLLHFLVFQFTVSLNASFPCRGTTLRFVREVFPILVIFLLLRQKRRDSNIFLYCSTIVSFGLHSRWVHPKYTLSRNDVGSSMSTFFIIFFHMGAILCFFPANLVSSTHTDKNNPCFRWTNMHSQFGTFSHPNSIKASSNGLSHNNPANGWPYKFHSRGTTGSSMFAHDFGHLCRGRRIHTSGHSGFVILSNLGASSNFTWVLADTASAARLSQPGYLATTSCRLGRRWALLSRSTTLPLYLCNFGSNSAFLRW